MHTSVDFDNSAKIFDAEKNSKSNGGRWIQN